VQRVNCSQVLPRQREQNAGDEAQQDDNRHEQTPDSRHTQWKIASVFCNPVSEFLQADFFLTQAASVGPMAHGPQIESSASGSILPHAMRNLPVATSFAMPVTGSCTRIALRLNPMMANLKNGGAPDRSRINMNDQYEVRHWTETLGCSEDELAAAVARVGNSSDEYGERFSELGHTGHCDAPFLTHGDEDDGTS